MNWVLVLMTAAGLQSVGSYETEAACDRAAREWRKQDVKAGCVQQQSIEEIFAKMQLIMNQMVDKAPK